MEMKAELDASIVSMANSENALSFDDSGPTKVFRKSHRRYLVYNGTLHVAADNNDMNGHLLLVVPKSLQRNIFELYHDLRGHPGTIGGQECQRMLKLIEIM